MIKGTVGKLGEGMSLERVVFNSPLGVYRKVGPPTFREFQERRIFNASLERFIRCRFSKY